MGYLVIEGMLTDSEVASLKAAVDRLEQHAAAHVDLPPRKRADSAFDMLADHGRTMDYIRTVVMPRPTVNNSEIRIRYTGNATPHYGGMRLERCDTGALDPRAAQPVSRMGGEGITFYHHADRDRRQTTTGDRDMAKRKTTRVPSKAKPKPAARKAAAASVPKSPAPAASTPIEGAEVTASLVLGRTQVTLDEALSLGEHSIVDLDRGINDSIDIVIGGQTVARGEVITLDEHFGVRITEVLA